MTTASHRRDILAQLASDIRRVSGAHTAITLDVALANWDYFFQAGRYTEARSWWSVVERMMATTYPIADTR